MLLKRISQTLSLVICLYDLLLLAGLPGYTLCPYTAVVDKFKLVVLHLCVYAMWSIKERRIWVRLCFFSRCPECLVRLIWMAFEMDDMWPYSCCFVGCCFQDLFNIARSIIVQLPSSFFYMRLVSVHVVHPYSSMDTTTARKKFRFILSDRYDFHLTYWLLPCLRLSRIDVIFSRRDAASEVGKFVH